MFSEQLFYLTNDRLWAYQWRDGTLSAGLSFPAGRAGLKDFSHYLGSCGATPAYLIADLIEEDFQRHLLPHVGGKSGRALVARRLGQLYRDTPYRHATILSRETEGRRDDCVLFCALTNAAAVQPWVQALERRQVPLAGMYSMTLLSAALVRALRLDYQHLLLVTEQSGGLRQSYFQDGRLHFSRLTPAVGRDGAAPDIVAETERTHQFLTSTRLLARGDVLYAAVLSPAGQLPRLVALCHDRAELAYHFIDMEDAARRLGLEPAPALLEQLLLSQLAKKAPASHFALGRPGRFYRQWQARLGLRIASAATLAGALLWLGANLWASHGAAGSIAALTAETARLEAHQRALQATLAPTPVRPGDMKAAALIERMVTARGSSPAPLLAIVSQALDRVPQIEVNVLDWQLRLPGGAPAPGDDRSAAMAPAASLLRGAPAQSLRIEAEVMPTQGDERSILASMDRFVQELARHPKLQVELEQAPLDLRSNARLTGKVGLEPDGSRAKFILQLGWNP